MVIKNAFKQILAFCGFIAIIEFTKCTSYVIFQFKVPIWRFIINDFTVNFNRLWIPLYSLIRKASFKIQKEYFCVDRIFIIVCYVFICCTQISQTIPFCGGHILNAVFLFQSNKALEETAAAVFKEKVAILKLEMVLIYVEYTFDKGKLLFYFTADGRVDFRELIKELAKNGQIITQYVDFDGNATNDIAFNPNNSDFAIEGIVSPDGRVLGKMGHSERTGAGLYKNVPGEFDLKLFESAVEYYK